MTLYVRALAPISLSVSEDGTGSEFTLNQRVSYKVLPVWAAQKPGFQRLWAANKVQVATDSAFTHVVTSIPTSETATSTILSVNGKIGDVVLTKSDIGLENADNTSDANKPVSTAAQTALNLKANLSGGAAFSGTVSATNPRWTSPLITNGLFDSSGNALLGINRATSAVSYFTLSNAATGNPLTLTATGTDADIGLNLVTKGTGTVQANGQQILTKNMGITLDYQFTANGMKFASANDASGYPLLSGAGAGGAPANYFRFLNANTGVAPTFSAIGTDTNVSLNFATKGTGTVQANGVDVVTTTGTQTLTNKTVTKSINAQTGTSYTLVLADASKLVTLSNGSAITLTVPTNTGVAFPVGATIDLAQLDAGQVTFAPADGTVTINSTPGLKIAAQYGGATLTKLATNTWLLVGALAA